MPPSAGTFPTTGGLFVGLLVGVILIIGGLTFFPALALGPDRRASRDDAPARCSHRIDPESAPWKPPRSAKRTPASALLDPKIVCAGDRLGLRQARSAHADQESGDVRARDRHRADHGHLRPRPGDRRRDTSASSSRSSCGSGSPCCSRTSPRRSPKAAARRRPTRCAGRAPRRRRSCSTGLDRTNYKLRAGHQPEGRRRRAGRGRRHHPVGRRGDRRRRLGQRGGDHRRIRAGHPRIRRRPLGGDRRHPGAVRLDQRAHHGGAGLDLPRPHDQAGRRRRAPEDAERDRAQHPAGRPDHHLRVRDRDDPELRRLCGRRRLGRRSWSRCS